MHRRARRKPGATLGAVSSVPSSAPSYGISLSSGNTMSSSMASSRAGSGRAGGIAGFFGALRRAGARRLAARTTFFRAGACRFRDTALFLPFAGALDFLLAVFRLAIFRFFAIACAPSSSDSLPMKFF